MDHWNTQIQKVWNLLRLGQVGRGLILPPHLQQNHPDLGSEGGQPLQDCGTLLVAWFPASNLACLNLNLTPLKTVAELTLLAHL